MQMYVKLGTLKYILDTTKGTTKMVIKGDQTEHGYLLDDNYNFAVYVDTDWVDNTVIAKDVVKLFKQRLEDEVGIALYVFHINNV